jgi:hypothetical protein
MTEPEIQALIERAVEAGARRALVNVGLHDEDAGKDVQELRGLLETWRDTKRTITQTDPESGLGRNVQVMSGPMTSSRTEPMTGGSIEPSTSSMSSRRRR